MSRLRESKYRFAKYYCDLASQCSAIGDVERIDLENTNIIRGVETSEEIEDYSILSLYVKSLGKLWVGKGGSDWIHYKHFVPVLLTNFNLSLADRKEYLSNLATIEESEGNYRSAKSFLIEMVKSIVGSSNINDHNDLVEVAKRMIGLANLQNNYEDLEEILLQGLQCAIDAHDLKQQVDILLQLTMLPDVKNDYSKLTEYIDRGLQLANSIGYRVGAIDNLRALASLYLAQKQFEKAKQYYQSAIDLAIGINDIYRVNEIEKQLKLLREHMAKKVFISYNNDDRAFVKKLASDLQNSGLSVWWDEWEIKVGDSIIEKVSNGITTSAHLMVVLSPSSVNSSWVQREVNSALMKQVSSEKSITILPVLLKDCNIPILLQDIRWADFRKSYKMGLHDLLKAIA